MGQIELLQKGIVINTLPFRETDLIVNVLTEHQGKIRALVRGVRRSKKRFMGGVDILEVGLFEFRAVSSTGDLCNLISISQREYWTSLRKNFFHLVLASFCLEITNRLLLEGDQEGSLAFIPLRHALREIDLSKHHLQSTKASILYSIELLQLSGFYPFEESEIISPFLLQWFKRLQMGEETLPNLTVLNSKEILHQGFSFIVTYIEQLINMPIRSRQHVLQLFSDKPGQTPQGNLFQTSYI